MIRRNFLIQAAETSDTADASDANDANDANVVNDATDATEQVSFSDAHLLLKGILARFLNDTLATH